MPHALRRHGDHVEAYAAARMFPGARPGSSGRPPPCGGAEIRQPGAASVPPRDAQLHLPQRPARVAVKHDQVNFAKRGTERRSSGSIPHRSDDSHTAASPAPRLWHGGGPGYHAFGKPSYSGKRFIISITSDFTPEQARSRRLEPGRIKARYLLHIAFHHARVVTAGVPTHTPLVIMGLSVSPGMVFALTVMLHWPSSVSISLPVRPVPGEVHQDEVVVVPSDTMRMPF